MHYALQFWTVNFPKNLMCKNFPIMDPITIIPTLLRTQTLYLHRLKPMQHISDLLPPDFLVYKVYVIKACILCSIVFKEDTRIK